MLYNDQIKDEVRSRNDIVDVIGQYVSLKKKGANYVGLCPFHNEKSGSFSVSPTRQMYHCFGCGVGGDVFRFIQEYENLTFPEALKVLADRAGIELPQAGDPAKARAERDKKQTLLEINKEAARYFYSNLKGKSGEKGLAYFRERKLSDETIRHFGLGYSNISPDDLVRHLREKGYKDAQIIEAGLASFDEKRGCHDKFWNRVMFPIMDASGKVIGFGGRVMGQGEPKYMNSPETPVFDKSRNLFGLNYARSARAGFMILCEGYMDVIAMHQAGYNMAVASLGTAFTTGQAMILKRYTDTVILSYDSDGPGTKAALRAIEILSEVGLKGKVLDLRPHKDPDEFIKNEGKEAFEERLKNAQNTFFFELRVMEDKADFSDPVSKTEFYRNVAARLCEFTEPLERMNYIEAAAAKYNIPLEDLKKLVADTAAQGAGIRNTEKPRPAPVAKKAPDDGARKNQRLLLTWLASEPRIYPKVSEWITPDDFADDLYRRVAGEVFDRIKAGDFVPARILDLASSEEEQNQISAILNTELVEIETSDERRKAFKEIILSIRHSGYERQKKEMAPDDPNFLTKTIQAKKELEKLSHADISPD